MIVTKIERQRRRPERHSLFIDGEFVFCILNESLIRYGLRAGDTITPATLRALETEGETFLARTTATNFLRKRRRTENELRLRLAEDEFREETIGLIVGYFKEKKLIDDWEYCRAFVRDAQLRKPTGNRLLSVRLRQKGISPVIIR